MKRYIAGCVVSGIMGALIALAMTQAPHEPLAVAQPAFQPPPPIAPLTARNRAVDLSLADDDTNLQRLSPEERINIQVYERVNRGVVNITTRATTPDAFFLFDAPVEGAGSGSVLDEQGHILTNFHVIESAREIHVTLYNGESHEAGVIGLDTVNDMAVLRINAPADVLFPVRFGDSAKLKVGQKVFAIGNPFGLERTMTTGIISSLNRSLPSRSDRTMKSIIQLDAALNRGNSGGPLLDSGGLLIGMNTAIASKTGENTGIGFAIPVNTVKRIVPQLIENGRVIRPSIGITQAYQTEQGLLVVAMAPGGPAELAGLRGFRVVRQQRRRGPFIYEETQIDRSQADLIVAVGGQATKTKDEFMSAIESHRPGDEVTITVIREGQQIDVPVTLGGND